MTPTLRKLAELAGLGTVLVAMVLWITSQLGDRATNARADAIEQRVQLLEGVAIENRINIQWMKSALWALTQHAGVVVPPPPGVIP